MKPEDLLDASKLPEDLKWLVVQYRLQPNDPVFLLVAWHWNRIKACEDTVRAAVAGMKATLDSRIARFAEAADTVADVSDALVEVQTTLEEKPVQLGQQFEAKFAHPAAATLAHLQALEKSLASLSRAFQVAQRRQLLAALLIGVALGVLSAVIVGLA